jgi:hypothetical protein
VLCSSLLAANNCTRYSSCYRCTTRYLYSNEITELVTGLFDGLTSLKIL